VTSGAFAMYGAVDAEVGIVFVPAMMISVFAGIDGLLPITAFFFPFMASPVAGVRVTWGAF
jgi:hypothetical protein